MNKEIIIRLVNSIYGGLSLLVPKKKNYYVFLPLHNKKKLSGNIRALLVYAAHHYPDLDIVLVSHNERVIREAEKEKITIVHHYISIFWAILRAEHLIIDRNSLLFRAGKFSLIQLWHGIGFKNVGLMNENFNLSKKEARKHFQKYDLFVTSSDADVEKTEKSFGVKTSVITGLPRNDVFFKSEEYRNKVKKNYGLEHYSKIIAYTPTFRDKPTKEPFSDDFWNKLEDYLIKENILFVVKKHPWDKFLKIPASFTHVKDISTEIEDIQDLLVITDLLISDYSSIVTDFALTERPIIIYDYDLKQYQKNCRSLYYDLEKTLPRPFIKREKELLEKIKDNSWFTTTEIQESYAHFKHKFHQFEDGCSCKRVMEAILNLG